MPNRLSRVYRQDIEKKQSTFAGIKENRPIQFRLTIPLEVAMKIFAFSVIAACSMTSLSWGDGSADRVEVVFQTSDQGTVHAMKYGKGSQGVVLAHGAVFNKESWDAFARKLGDRGVVALAVDFRRYGLSRPGTRPDALHEDLLAAVRYLHEKGIERVALIGASMGGGAAAEASIQSKPGEIEKLILLSPVPIEHPERLKGSLLFIASADESLAKKITAQFDRAPEPKRLIMLKGNAHAQHIFKTDQAGILENAMLGFLID
jgi:pimeloyl-ACP methyl ester carboxylesterase